MYKSILFADPHLKDREAIGGLDDKRRSIRTTQKLFILRDTIKYAIDNKVDSIICLGDLFDNPYPSEKLKLAVAGIFKLALDASIKIYLLGGNHDTADGLTYNFMSESTFNDNLIFADFYSIEVEDNVLQFCSYGFEPELEYLELKKDTILFGHFQIDGAKYSNEHLCKSFIDPTSLSKFRKVFCGHFHKRQKHYIGSLCRNDFGERDNPTGFVLLEIENEEIKDTYIEVDDIKYSQYEFKVLTEEEIYKSIDTLELENHVVKLKFDLGSGFLIHRNKIKEYAKNKDAFDVMIEYIRDNDKLQVKIERNLSHLKAFEEYTKMMDVNKEYVEKGLKIVEEIFL